VTQTFKFISSLIIVIVAALVAGGFTMQSSFASRQQHIENLMLEYIKSNKIDVQLQTLDLIRGAINKNTDDLSKIKWWQSPFVGFWIDSAKRWNSDMNKRIDKEIGRIRVQEKIEKDVKTRSNIQAAKAQLNNKILCDDTEFGKARSSKQQGASCEANNIVFSVFKPFAEDKTNSDYPEDLQKDIQKKCNDKSEIISKWRIWYTVPERFKDKPWYKKQQGTKYITCSCG